MKKYVIISKASEFPTSIMNSVEESMNKLAKEGFQLESFNITEQRRELIITAVMSVDVPCFVGYK